MPSMVPLETHGAVIVLGFLFMAIFLALVFWVYSDAQKHSEQSAILWALVVFFAPMLGLLLYFLLGRNKQPDRPPRRDSGSDSRKRPPM